MEKTPESNKDASSAVNSPWYKDGLQFTCTQCGNCCSGAPGYVWVTPDEIQQIAEFKGVSLGEMQIHYLRHYAGGISLREFANGDCVFLDGATRRCTIYPVRPAQCRTWPFWNSNLESEETWKRVKSVCPGAGCGQLHDLVQINSLSSVVDI